MPLFRRIMEYQKMNTVNIDLSYKYPLNEKSKIELGYDGKINDNKETMNFEITNTSDELFEYKCGLRVLPLVAIIFII